MDLVDDFPKNRFRPGVAGVYILTEKTTGEVLYIGQSSNMVKRIEDHKTNLSTPANLVTHLRDDSSAPVDINEDGWKDKIEERVREMPGSNKRERKELVEELSEKYNPRY